MGAAGRSWAAAPMATPVSGSKVIAAPRAGETKKG
eukprot:CAMPEP_0185204496 /NCGR_PEP_ID=MMETSP1140-20130426/54933_1 /TAXON_ID=298111 /ORGANISM="Pavlova sp., Strain CCMP459" /LENGTH=34 /DNA_ID= /DNA_START= /DNA_END= /DNA_ORIENTATION=